MPAVTPAEAERRLAALASALEQSEPTIARTFAEAVLVRAIRRAADRPTPQSRMVSQAAFVHQDTVEVAEGQRVSGRGGSVLAGVIAGGSEYGSSIYRQFHAPHSSRGYWFFPAAGDAEREPSVERQADEVLQSVINRVVRV